MCCDPPLLLKTRLINISLPKNKNPRSTTRLVVLVRDGVHEGLLEVERRPVLPEGVVVAGGVTAMEGEARLADADPGLV